MYWEYTSTVKKDNTAVPILVYHSISESEIHKPKTEEEFYALSLPKFKQQLEYLNGQGFQAIGPDDLLEAVKGRKDLPSKPVILTFDDGGSSNYALAYPLFKQYNLKAVFFVVCGNIGKQGFVSWDELREMSSNNILIGSHGLTHRRLTRLSDEEVKQELMDSKNILEQKLERPVKYFAVPGGFYNRRIKAIAKEAGYRGVCTSGFGVNYQGADLFSLKRIGIRYNTSINEFRRIVLGRELDLLPQRLFWAVKSIFKCIIGVERYTGIKIRKK